MPQGEVSKNGITIIFRNQTREVKPPKRTALYMLVHTNSNKLIWFPAPPSVLIACRSLDVVERSAYRSCLFAWTLAMDHPEPTGQSSLSLSRGLIDGGAIVPP